MRDTGTQVVALTGGAGTLGAGIARAFLRVGAHVVLGDLDEQGLGRAVEDLGVDRARVLPVVVDVTDPASVDRFVDAAADHFGTLDVVVNNAGIVSKAARLHNVDPDDVRRVFEVNVMGTVHGMQAALRHFRPRGAGVVVNTASISGLAGWPGTAPYCASKAAVVNLTRTAALEYGREGIRVNAVCPGAFQSPINQDLDATARDRILAAQPSGRLGTVDEVASAFVYLASDGASWVNGETLVVDGGFLAM